MPKLAKFDGRLLATLRMRLRLLGLGCRESEACATGTLKDEARAEDARIGNGGHDILSMMEWTGFQKYQIAGTTDGTASLGLR